MKGTITLQDMRERCAAVGGDINDRDVQIAFVIANLLSELPNGGDPIMAGLLGVDAVRHYDLHPENLTALLALKAAGKDGAE